MKNSKDFSGFSLQELFRLEAEQQVTALTSSLLKLEANPSDISILEALMRAAHSLKGAARVVRRQPVVDIAHLMEDSFVGALQGRLMLDSSAVDILLQAADVILELAPVDESGVAWEEQHSLKMQALLSGLSSLRENNPATLGEYSTDSTKADVLRSDDGNHLKRDSMRVGIAAETALKVALKPNGIRQLDRLMALSSELLVEGRWVSSHLRSMHRLKRVNMDLTASINKLRLSVQTLGLPEMIRMQAADVHSKANQVGTLLAEKVTELDIYDRRTARLADRLHREVVASRMRPFRDCLVQLPRLTRDVARVLGKSAALNTSGHQTLLDRDIVVKLDIPLKHLINNALDHGIETPSERENSGKSPVGRIAVSAFQRKGAVFIAVEDDGRGIDLQQLRKKIVAKGLATNDLAQNITDAELMDFLFLPGFSTRDVVTEISGRGVGLDVVRDMVQALQGTVRAESQWGKGMRILLQFPLTLSIVPTLLVEIAGEPFGIALARIERVIREEQESFDRIEGPICWRYGDQTIALFPAHALLELPHNEEDRQKTISAVVLTDGEDVYGLVVDRLLGERDLVVQALPAHLGRVKDISSGAIMEDGTPALMIDVDDILLACKKALISGFSQLNQRPLTTLGKRILVVDDSLTVREVQRKILEAEGYQVATAVDGVDAWNTLRAEAFDLMISDVDMPRMNGIELVRMLKRDDSLRKLPVMIVSYKDRDEDRFRGMDAGADYYLGKGNFQDDALRNAVFNLIGNASS